MIFYYMISLVNSQILLAVYSQTMGWFSPARSIAIRVLKHIANQGQPKNWKTITVHKGSVCLPAQGRMKIKLNLDIMMPLFNMLM